MQKNEYAKEVKSKRSKIEQVDESLHEVYKSICKISYTDKDSKIPNLATGFFIRLFIKGKELFCLMTNNHVIEKKTIESNVILNIKYKYEKKFKQIKLDEKGRYIKYNNKLDFTIIEIKPEDGIKEKYFLLPNIGDINYLDKSIYIIQFPLAEKLHKSEGKIIKINSYEIIYDASTDRGSSGSPIFLEDTSQVIGIHKGGYKIRKENYGTKLLSILQLLNSEKNNDKLMKEINDIKTKDFKEIYGYYLGEVLDNKNMGKE